MTADEFKVVVKTMKSVYPKDNLMPDADAVKLWFELLKDLPYEETTAFLAKWVQNEKYSPTIAEIRKGVLSVTKKGFPDWGSAWELVLSAVKKYGYQYELSALKSLPAPAAKAARNLGWYDICTSENIGIIRSQFKDLYEREISRLKETAFLSPGVSAALLRCSEAYVAMLEASKKMDDKVEE